MSTYWYLECLAHSPALCSDDEVEQHTEGLPAIERLYAAWPSIQAIPAEYRINLIAGLDTQFERAAARFFWAHPSCPIHLRNEYGETRPMAANGRHARTQEGTS